MSLKECINCKGLVEESSTVCEHCGGSVFADPMAINERKIDRSSIKKTIQKRKSKNAKTNRIVLMVIAIIISLITLMGNVHFIHGSTYSGPLIVKKVSFSFSETFVNTDKVFAMPYISALSTYPLAVAALRRLGVLESEKAREDRIKKEVNDEIEKTQREIEEEMNFQ